MADSDFEDFDNDPNEIEYDRVLAQKNWDKMHRNYGAVR